ncbi:phosphoribosylanthranilate isomerase [Lutimonas sp.]|uniref:phosphoribosylanthranilate isomerase n=1 Tax=Lutimonas sp. TaxID=1872403 RepID=UPI003D9AE2E5
MKVKVCGMKYEENIRSVAGLDPDYLGFIFYEKSKRFFEGEIPEIDRHIKKAGVFVNATEAYVNSMIKRHNLNAVQLHGDESAAYCQSLGIQHKNSVEIVKAFSMSEDFDFEILRQYKASCDYFLFDTKGKERGGNGTLFDWKLLEKYTLDKPFFLSGGIGLSELSQVEEFLRSPLATHCYAIDVNSKFETKPGMKKTRELKEFIELIAKDK